MKGGNWASTAEKSNPVEWPAVTTSGKYLRLTEWGKRLTMTIVKREKKEKWESLSCPTPPGTVYVPSFCAYICATSRESRQSSSECHVGMCRDDRMWSGEARAVDIFPVRLTGSAALAVPNVMATLQTRCLLSIFLVNLPKCVILKGKPIKTCALLLRELLNCCIPVVIQDSFCVLLNYVWK